MGINGQGQEQKHSTKILIVDDNIQMRKLLRLTFNYGDYEIMEAENGHEALKMIIKNKPDIVLLDIMMPGDIDGLAVCDFVKSSTLANTRVILLTAKGQKDDVQQGNDAGADFYITKPFSPVALTELVESLVRKSSG